MDHSYICRFSLDRMRPKYRMVVLRVAMVLPRLTLVVLVIDPPVVEEPYQSNEAEENHCANYPVDDNLSRFVFFFFLLGKGVFKCCDK